MQTPLIYRPKSVFGLDVGRTTIKIAQVKATHSGVEVTGYAYAKFDQSATQNGEIVKPDLVINTIHDLFKRNLVGKISTSRIVASVPIAHIFTRVLQLPKLADKDLAEAVRLEAEQYVPVSSKDLYIDYHQLPQSAAAAAGSKEPTHPVLMVAVPKKIVTSYLTIFDRLGLEIEVIEPNMFANLRVIDFSTPLLGSKLVIDFGARSSDLAIYDTAVRLTSTIDTGGDNITQTIAATLKLSNQEANQLKIRYGIAKSRWQERLATALQPILSNFATEVQKMMRYYQQHNQGTKNVDHIVLVGGGANMPGLADFLSHLTGVSVQICNPWTKLKVKPLQPPPTSETTIYATALGLALKEIIRD